MEWSKLYKAHRHILRIKKHESVLLKKEGIFMDTVKDKWLNFRMDENEEQVETERLKKRVRR